MIRRLLPTLVLLAVASPALADDPRPLSYEDAIALAVQHAPGVVQADLAREQAQQDLRSANGAYDPMLNVTSRFDRSLSLERFGQIPDPFKLTSDGWSTDLSLSEAAPTGTSVAFDAQFSSSRAKINLQDSSSPLAALFGDGGTQKSFRPSFQLTLGQELLRGVLLSYNLQGVRHAREGLTIAELRTEAAKQQAIADAARAYWTWVQLVRTAEIAHHAVSVADENLRVGTAKVDAGQLAPIERTRLEAASVEARANAIDADHAAAQAEDALLLLLGGSPDDLVTPTSLPGDAPPLSLDAQQVEDAAIEGSLDLALQRAAVDAAQRSFADARHAVLPSLRASVNGGLTGFDDQSWSDAFTLGESMFPDVGVGGTLSVPLGFRASMGAAGRAEAEVTRQRALLDDTTAQVRASVAQQLRVLTAAGTRIQLADKQIELARQTLASEEALHDAGRALLQDVLEARTALDKAEVDAIRARTDFRIAEIELRRLQGNLDAP